MLAAVLTDFNNLVLKEVPVPEPGMNEVVVRVKACGICATDYKAIKGIRTNVMFPFIPGHEASGLVSAVGPGTATPIERHWIEATSPCLIFSPPVKVSNCRKLAGERDARFVLP